MQQEKLPGKIVSRLIAVTVIPIILLTTVELSVRWLWQSEKESYLVHPSLRWALSPRLERQTVINPVGKQPFELSTDEDGLRTCPFETTFSNPFSIVILGDSEIMGWGVDDEDCYPCQLQSLLRAQIDVPAVRVINAAHPGFSTFQTLQLFNQIVRHQAPRIVIVHLTCHNYERGAVSDREFTRGGTLTRFSLDLYQHCLLARLLRNCFVRSMQWIQYGINMDLSTDKPPFDFERRVSPAEFQALAEEFRILALHNNFKLIWVAEECSLQQIGRMYFDFIHPVSGMVHVYDPIPDMVESGVCSSGYYQELDPGHWSVAGNRVMAEMMTEFLFRYDLLPVPDNRSHPEVLPVSATQQDFEIDCPGQDGIEGGETAGMVDIPLRIL